ncbi:hypothetical protein ACFCP7_15380 [Paenibacillus elgii]
MTYDAIYWLMLGAGFVLTGLVGVLMMWKTEKLLLSFLAGTAVNVLLTAGALWWWSSAFAGSEQQFSRMFGLFGLGVSFANNEVLLFFTQLIMKKKIGGDPAPDTDA